MAITTKSLASLMPADSAGDSDLTHTSKGSQDKSLSVARLKNFVNNVLFPIGITEFFAQDRNPNLDYPGQKWSKVSDGGGRTVRISSESGSDASELGGDDYKTLVESELPAHTHGIALQTSSFSHGTKLVDAAGEHRHGASTNYTGDHQHQDGMNAPGAQYSTAGKGTNNQSQHKLGLTSNNGAHTHSIGIVGRGLHTHDLPMGQHAHALTGNTYLYGSGTQFRLHNEYIRLQMWIRIS